MESKEWVRKSSLIALKVNAALAEKKIPKQELAARLGVTPQYVSRIVKGGENLTLETITRLEKALGISLGDRRKPEYRRRTSSRIFPSFHPYPEDGANPELFIRKALVFEGNVPEEPEAASLKVSYQTRTRIRPEGRENLLEITVLVQYQYESRICADIELRLEFHEENLASRIAVLPDGSFDCAESFLEERLLEVCCTVRGLLAGLVSSTGLKKFPLPDYSEEELESFNSLILLKQ